MRFIHTADWHLGNQIHNINRTEEYIHFFDWLKKTIVEKGVETLIISGDIFDVVNPSVEARKLYYSFLAGLSETCCSNIVVIGGNHDSGNMLDSSKDILEKLNIFVVGTAANLTFEQMVFELKNKENETIGICLAVPFMREVELKSFLENQELTDIAENLCDKGYKEVYDRAFEIAEKLRGGRDIPIIATGHLHTAGLSGLRSEENEKSQFDDGVKNLDVIGNLGKVHSNIFPQKIDYVALGHIHYTTMVSKNPKIRYSGSPFLMGFDECRIRKCVLLVDATSKELDVQKIEIENPLFLYNRIEGSIEEIKNALENLKKENIQKQTFLELFYKPEANKNIEIELEDSIKNLPENIHIANIKVYSENAKKIDFEGFSEIEIGEIKNIDEKTLFTNLILSKLNLQKDSVEAEEALKTCLPLFMEIMGEVEIENS